MLKLPIVEIWGSASRIRDREIKVSRFAVWPLVGPPDGAVETDGRREGTDDDDGRPESVGDSDGTNGLPDGRDVVPVDRLVPEGWPDGDIMSDDDACANFTIARALRCASMVA